MTHLTAPALRLLPALALLLAPVLAGCTGGDDGPAPGSAPSSAAPTSLDAYDTAGLSLGRTSPCPALSEDAVARALGGDVAGSSTWANGERARLAIGVRDVAQEAGCAFRGEAGTSARAWVFAPPVAPSRARAVERTLRSEQGCRRVADAPAFGEPGVGRTCVRQDRVVASFGGLFGEAWLGCSVAVPRSAARGDDGRSALVRRTGEWCVRVVEAAQQETDEAAESADSGDGDGDGEEAGS